MIFAFLVLWVLGYVPFILLNDKEQAWETVLLFFCWPFVSGALIVFVSYNYLIDIMNRKDL